MSLAAHYSSTSLEWYTPDHRSRCLAGCRGSLGAAKVMTSKPSTPQWVPDPGSQAYTLINGDFRCRVWPAFVTWSALVRHRGVTTTALDFNTIDEACAWCEARVAERQAGT